MSEELGVVEQFQPTVTSPCADNTCTSGRENYKSTGALSHVVLLPHKDIWKLAYPCECCLTIGCRLVHRAAQSFKVQWAEVSWQQVVAQVVVTGRAMILVVIDISAGLPLRTISTGNQNVDVQSNSNKTSSSCTYTYLGRFQV